jgi:calcium binding protein 39
MVLLKDPSRSIQFEAFHVFKIFVANPHKTPAVAAILASNRGKLLKHLTDFQADRDGDEQFAEEKAVVLREIAALGEEGGGGGAPA